MPIETTAPLVMLSARVDLRPFAGRQLFKQGAGGAAVTAPTASTWTGKVGLFRDIIDALVGHGTELGLGDDLQAQWAADGGAGTVSLGIDSDGKPTITNSSGGGDALELKASTDNAAWGFPTAGVSIADGETYTGVDFPNGLTGTVGDTPPYMTFERPASATTFTVPAVPAYFTDVRVSLRTRTTIGDIDSTGHTDPSECIEALDNDATDPTDGSTNRRVRWALDWGGPTVRIVRTVGRSVTDASEALVWLDDDLRQNLGATGSEAVVSTGVSGRDVYVQTFDLHSLYILAPSLCRVRQLPRASVSRRQQTTRDQRTYNHVWASQQGWQLDVRVDGPADIDDQHLDWVEHTHQMMLAGPVCLFMRRGDSRRARRRRAGGDSLLYTTGDAVRDGYRGRIYCHIVGDETSVSWPTSLMRSALLSLELRVAKQETLST